MQDLHDLLPATVFAPPARPTGHGRPGPTAGRQPTPRHPSVCHPQDPLNQEPMIAARSLHDLVLVQSDLPFGLLQPLLDLPTAPRRAHQLVQREVGGSGHLGIRPRARVHQAAPDQDPVPPPLRRLWRLGLLRPRYSDSRGPVLPSPAESTAQACGGTSAASPPGVSSHPPARTPAAALPATDAAHRCHRLSRPLPIGRAPQRHTPVPAFAEPTPPVVAPDRWSIPPAGATPGRETPYPCCWRPAAPRLPSASPSSPCHQHPGRLPKLFHDVRVQFIAQQVLIPIRPRSHEMLHSSGSAFAEGSG